MIFNDIQGFFNDLSMIISNFQRFFSDTSNDIPCERPFAGTVGVVVSPHGEEPIDFRIHFWICEIWKI